MEPLDPAKNVEGSGHSRRRISSILKVTRKSSGTCESEQQENEVESAKPFEKRNSRRVSFAPATDVLLFAKDVKTASPTRNPLQELIAANVLFSSIRVQMAATDDGTQQIMGIENLLSAPLHGSHQSNMVSCDIPNDFGEKTVVFSTEDADMDMTCSHTINITGDAGTLKMQTHHDIFHTVGERRVVSDGVFADVSLSHTAATSSLPAMLFSGQKNDSSLVTNIPFVIPDFENIHTSLSKPSGFSSRTPLTGSSSEDTKSTGQTAIDKENQIPTLLSCSRNRSTSCPEDEGLGMAVAPGVVDEEDDDPFQCLFPAQDMYAHSDKRSSTVTEKKPEESGERSGSIELNGSASFTKPRDLSGNPEIPRTRPVTVPFSKATINTDGFPLQTPEAEVDRKEWALDNSKSCGILFDGGLKSSEEDFSMDLTDVHRGKILETMGSNDLFGVVFLSQSSNPAERTPAQEGVETSLQPFLKTQPQIHQVKPTNVKDYEEETLRLSADDDCMDVTKCHTLKIDSDVGLQLHQSVNLSPATREQTLRLAADDTAMDLTQCLTENAVSHLASDSDSFVGKGEDKTCDPTLSRSLSSHCGNTGYKNLQINPVRAQMGPFASQSDGFAVYPKDDISMDVTELQTGYILGGHVTMDVKDVQRLSQATHPQSVHPKMELMTSQQQSDTDHRPSSSKETLMGISLKTAQRLQAKFASEDPLREKTVRFTAADAGMDVTQYHTVNIIHDLPPHSISNVDLPANREQTVRFTTNDATGSHTEKVSTELNKQSHQYVNLLPADGEKTVRFSANDATMDVTQSHMVNIIHDLPPHSISKVDSPANGVKMVRLTTDDAAMDVTRSHTVSVSSHLNKPSHQYVNLPPDGEKTVRLTTDDAAMDVTRSHTVSVSSHLNKLSHQYVNLPPDGEKTVRFTTNDASIDVTRSHTANISTDLNTFPHQNVHQLPANGERTERFTPKRSLMDMTKSHTASFSTTFEPKLYQNVELQPPSVDETQRFTTEDACMDMTSCFTVNMTSNLASETVSLDQNMKFPPAAEKTDSGDCAPLSNRSSSAQVEQKYKSSTTQEADATDTPLPQEPAASCHFQLKTQKADTDAATESPSVVSDVVGKPVMETVTSCAEIGVTDILHQDVFSPQDHRSDHLEEREFSGNNTFLGSSISEVEAFNPSNYLDSNKMETAEEPLQTTEAFPEKAEPSAEGPDVDTKRSPTSRRISLADLRSKVRRLSNKIKAAADDVAEDPGAAPVPPPDLDMDKTSSSKTGPLPVVQPTFETSFETNTDDERPFAATPFNLKMQQLMSQLSVGRFKPKLPQRTNPDRSKRLASAGEATRTFSVSIASRLSDLDNVDHINDEELGSCEDLSESLDIRDAEKSFEKETSPKVDLALKLLDEPEGLVSPIQGQKRPLEDEDEDERSLKACLEHVGLTFEPLVEHDGNTAASHTTTQSVSSSSCSHTDSRCQAALEDYGDDGLGKLKDGTITVQEFFKLFKIDFVIHNPRQSILPGKLLSDSDVTPLDLLKNRHINRPRQAVYEADVQILTAKVEGLKVRTKDLDKPLKIVNEHLWEETRHFSENELKSFGAKLKENNNFFKKLGKVKTHEMKEELYSNLVRTSREQQQKVRGTIEEADKTIKHLDECICELEAEIFAVEEKGFGDKPGLKSLQEELTKVSDAVADKERRISELELETKQNSSKLEQMKAEKSSLQKHIDILNMMNEWRLGERTNKSTCYTFLHNTMFLQLEYEQLERSDADGGCEKKITNIAFKFELHPEKSQPHARLVHKLVSQYMEGESGWVEKYSTSQDVPKLLHDVSLVVSRCRMLGEELRLLKMWGGLRFDILDISCMDTQVRVVFSSMKRCSKFEVVFDVGLTDQLCAFQVQSFKNVFGSSSIQQIEDIVASLASGRKLLTRIIKKIHETLLQ
ncbi:transcript variant X3 [Nothobranchius furzeri]|uniref:Transcript variant X3 n=1 Tax=Nothobranchius furzeri TaxID=105023 RepID=A0A9D2Z1G1_NOTFU|nr:transcript variant X3 [Nothobranchius furzeri]